MPSFDLLDTNILLRYARAADPNFATVDASVRQVSPLRASTLVP